MDLEKTRDSPLFGQPYRVNYTNRFPDFTCQPPGFDVNNGTINQNFPSAGPFPLKPLLTFIFEAV